LHNITPIACCIGSTGAVAAPSKVFLGLLPGQADVYRVHLPWVEVSSPEAIRRAMLEVRRWNEAGLADFNRRLELAQKELGPKA
jgi:hypothetical protein